MSETLSSDPIDHAFAGLPDLDEKTRANLRFDLVSQIAGYGTIARRYGFKDEAGLVRFLQANKSFTQDVARMRAMFSSDMSAPERARLKALLASEEAIVDVFGIATNQNLPASTRIDAFKQLNRMGGVDGLPPGLGREGGGQSGTQFSLIINMPGGEGKPARQEKIFTTVVAGDIPEGVTESEEGKFEGWEREHGDA